MGGMASPTALGDLLADAGFVPEDPVDQHGEFCVRGGVVDFFPVGEDYPVRVEFAGDLIESLRQYDPGSQRSMTTLDRAAVVPLRETFERPRADGGAGDAGLDRDATFVDYLARLSMRAFVCERDECEKRVAKTVEQVRLSYEDAVGKGSTVPPPAALIVGWAEVQTGLVGVTGFETLGLDEVGDAETRRVSCQPALAFHGRLGAWVMRCASVENVVRRSSSWRPRRGELSGSPNYWGSTASRPCRSVRLSSRTPPLCWSLPASFPEVSASRRRVSRSGLRRTCLTKNTASVTSGGRSQGPSCLTCAT